MSPRPRATADTPRPCGHPREMDTNRCRVCDREAARRRKAGRLARVQARAVVPMRHGRPVVSAAIAALIEECRPAYVRAITKGRPRVPSWGKMGGGAGGAGDVGGAA